MKTRINVPEEYSDIVEKLGAKFDKKDNVIDLILGSLTEASTDGNWQ